MKKWKCAVGAAILLFILCLSSAYTAAVYVRAKFAQEQASARYNHRAQFPINRNRIRNSIQRARTETEAVRKKIIAASILPHTSVFETPEGYLATYYGFKIRGILDRGGGHCLLIYLHGHYGNPFDYEYHKSIIKMARRQQCDTLTFSPVGIGLNAGSASYPSARFGSEVTLSPTEAANHETYRYFKDYLYPDYTPLHLFISGHYAIIRHAITNYADVRMIGLSGGGWAVTMLAAMIPEVNQSVAWAGSLPHEYRFGAVDIGDIEQDGPFYLDFDYWTLYEMASLDDSGRRTRQAHLVYNRNDDCCFADPPAGAFKKDMELFGSAKVSIIDSDTHSIDPIVAERLLFPNF